MNTTVVAETIRRHVSHAGYIVFAFFLALVALLVSGFVVPGTLWPPLVTLLAIITGSAVVGPEFSTGTLQLIVSKPVRRSVYLVSRVAGVFAIVAFVAAIGVSMELGARFVLGRAPVPWQRLGEVFAGELLVAFLAIALLAFLGSLTRSYFNAAIYIGTQVALSVASAILGVARLGGNPYVPKIQALLERVSDVVFSSLPAVLTMEWTARTLGVAAVAIILGCVAFERREVPYSAD
ncbi:MAG TPA: ABC transporter permease subunit [Thermoanaerobaculia bacterium]|nr:ABC transporter permease subunit [Thermoanaerobaculia bacterium]